MKIKMKLSRIYPTTTPKVLLLSAALLSSCIAYSQTIVSVNFQGNNTNTLASGDSVGAPGYAAVNWNNFSGASGGPAVLIDSTGAASPVTLTSFAASGVGAAGPTGPNDTPQAYMFGGGLGTNFGNSTFQIDGLAAFSSYDLVVYYSNGTSFPGSRTQEFTTSSSATRYYSSGTSSAYTSYTRSNSVTNSTYASGNYVLYEGLSASSELVTMYYVNNYTTMTGFQVIGTAVPEPGETAAIVSAFALVGAWLLRRRVKAKTVA